MDRIHMQEKHFYTVPFIWGRSLWISTLLFFGLWIGLSLWLLYEVYMQGDMGALGSLIILNVVALSIVLICEGFAPQRLEIGASQIVILRRYNSIVISRSEIQSIEPIPAKDLRRSIRTGGVGGLFGYYGRYRSHKMGSFSLYATSYQNLYLIRKIDGKAVVISCSEPDKMEQFIES